MLRYDLLHGARKATFHLGAPVAEPAGALPYDPALWGELCFAILADGGVDGPFVEPTCENAACVVPLMPAGTKFRVLVRPVAQEQNPSSAIQLTDLSRDRRLFAERSVYPMLWARIDSTAPLDDLSSYNQLVSFSRLEVLRSEATKKIEVVILLTPQVLPLVASELPALQRRA